MTGAPLSNASRRADGLATSAVLDQKYLLHAIETTRRCFEISDVGAGFKPALQRGMPAQLNAPTNVPFRNERGRERAKRDRRGMHRCPALFGLWLIVAI